MEAIFQHGLSGSHLAGLAWPRQVAEIPVILGGALGYLVWGPTQTYPFGVPSPLFPGMLYKNPPKTFWEETAMG